MPHLSRIIAKSCLVDRCALPLVGRIALAVSALFVVPSLLAWQSDNGDGTFSNPVLYADYPDPDIIRVGDDFYMVSTTFVDVPGIRILHSQDLVNWEIAGHAAIEVDGGEAYDLEGDTAYRGGYWACSLRHHDGTFYVLVNPTFGNARLYYADDVSGDWQYHQLDRPAYDPGLFFDDDGTGYIVSGHSRMTLMELSSDYSSVVSQTNDVFDAGGEGAHVIKRGDYYYVFNANPTVWPFQLRCSRATDLQGPWETGHVVLTATTGGHQGSVVELADGSWFGFVHQDSGAIGRMPNIGPVFWEDDWPVFGTPDARDQIADTYEKPILGKAIAQPATSDDFTSSELGLQWQWNHNPDASKWSLSERSGYLRLKPSQADRFWTARNTLTQKGQGPESHGIVKLDVSALQSGDRAGIGTLGKVNSNIFVSVDSEGSKTLRSSMDHRGVGAHDGAVPIALESDTVYLRVDLDFVEELGMCSYSYDGESWTRFGGIFTLGFDITHATFQGQKFALFCYNTETDDSPGYVDVDSFTFGETADQVTLQRGWAVLNEAGTTFVADNGQLIRGPFASTEWGNPPPRENLAKLKELGLNAVHLYGEVFDPDYPAEGSQAPGYSAARMDSMVEMTRELGLYLVITIGNGANNGDYNYDYIIDFWDFYAPRYADETHVIFEIQNEPVAWTPPYSQAVLDMEVDAYNTIRSHAPDTPVLLMTYAVLSNWNAALSDLSKIHDDIDWSNAAVGFHGYAGHEETPPALEEILDAGYPMFMTEFTTSEWGYSLDHIDLEMTATLERLQISWLNFLHVPPNFINEAISDPTAYSDIVNRSGLGWVPDYGDWPQQRGVFGNQGLPRETTSEWVNDKLTGTLRVEAEDFDTGGQGIAYNDRDSENSGGQYRLEEGVDIQSVSDGGSAYAVTSTESGEWLEYTIFAKEPGLYTFRLRYASNVSDGAIRADFNGVDATGVVDLSSTGGSGNWSSIEEEVFLDYGQQKVRLSIESGGVRLNWFELTPVSNGPIADGTYRFVNRKSGLAAGVDLGSYELIQEAYEGDAQEWEVTHLGAGNYRVTWVNQSLNWSIGLEQNNDDPVEVVPWSDLTRFRRMLVVPSTDGYYRIRNAASGLETVPLGASVEQDAGLVQYVFDGKPHHYWAIQSGSEAPFPTGLTLDVANDGYEVSWSAVEGADSYSVKRSSTPGGPYAVIAQGVTDTRYKDQDVTIGEIWYYVVSSKSGATESPISAEVVANPPRLFASFPLDEGSGVAVYDDSGSGWQGELMNGATWAEGRGGSVVEFDGTNDHILLSQGIMSELTDLTLSVWTYLDATPTWSRIIDFGSGTGNYMFITPSGAGGVARFAMTIGSGEQLINGPEALPIGEWVHVAVTLQGSTGILYVNGEEVGRNEEMSITPQDLGVTTQNYIGKSQWPDPHLDGKVDDLRIYSNAFDADGVLALFEEEPRPPISEQELASPGIVVYDSVAYVIIEETVPGRGYQLEVCQDISDPIWEAVGGFKIGDGEELTLEMPWTEERVAGFFRVRLRK
ncbi:family 43 glycosylhydrolase [Pelagicoccus sp. SDUM812003]|uniref:family 43 glycosylhydrolase n=1 Tax=Pelagicoccus sp. SDUM812003 TaxID=3041267 RepID=UPI00281003C2|nr:family 43 glycosylhydrolase [Pelagicoccus sp. SDUM812003]MDQ8203518.1 family 43 glycosylhydrolase [Pelagicoccus sp. SDUM812003]